MLDIFYFTFGCGQKNAGRVQKILASSYEKARALMFKHFGEEWCFQYTAGAWEEAKHQAKQGGYSLEKEMDAVIVEGRD